MKTKSFPSSLIEKYAIYTKLQFYKNTLLNSSLSSRVLF